MLGLNEPSRFSATNALALIALFTAIKIVLAAVFPPTIDEAYAIAVSRQWSLSYFDHPPLGFTIARLMAWFTGSENIWVMRLPYIAIGAFSAWLIYKITAALFDAASAFWALGWFLVAPFFFISSGHFVVPDGPLNLALLASFWCLMPILLYDRGGTHWKPWLGFGFFLALALTAKYQAVLYGVSVLLFLTFSPFGRAQLKTAPPWVAAGIAVLGIMPMLIWNAQNGFISFSFQTARAGGGSINFEAANFTLTLLGQAVYLLPGTFVVALIMAMRRLRGAVTSAENALSWIIILPFGVFAVIAAISTGSLPHWPMSGFLFAFPLVGAWCATNINRFPHALPRTLKTTMFAIPALAVFVGLQANYSIVTRAFTAEKTELDTDWRLGAVAPIKSPLVDLDPAQTVYTTNWARAGKLALALGPKYDVIPLTDPRHFQFSNAQPTDGTFVDFVQTGWKRSQTSNYTKTLSRANLEISGDAQVTPIKSGAITKYQLVRIPVKRSNTPQN